MSTTLSRIPFVSRSEKFVERWFYTWMATAMIVVSIAGFAPALMNPVGRRSPVSWLAATHGVVYFIWLLIFLAQSSLIAMHRVRWHRRLGVVSTFVLAFMVPLGFVTTVTMVRRGFDLSGDQQIEPNPRAGFLDPITGSIFNFVSLFLFAALVIAALGYRRRSSIHKRLMFFANLELILASIVHLLGHTKMLNGATVEAFSAAFLLAIIGKELFVERRVHPLTITISIAILALGPIQAVVIGPSDAWHRLVSWLVE